MAKPASTAATGEAPRDWFLSAITTDGSVEACLDAVLGELAQRSDFVLALRHCLVAGPNAALDQVTELGLRLRALENTLRVRLGMLLPERPAAWFRAPAMTSVGPFQTTLLGAPVFAAYDASAVTTVQEALETTWAMRAQPTMLPFKDDADCLWRTLLEMNARLEEICRLPAPFSTLRLDQLPDGLPEGLATRALSAFLINVRTEILATRGRLADCYQQLHETSLKLWALQREEERQRTKGTKGAGAADNAGGRSGGRSAKGAAEDIRSEFRRRRAAQAGRSPFLSPADMEALRFMGFNDIPAPDLLRQRYLSMAKQLHPDLQGGSDHEFKRLAGAYALLSARPG